MKSLRHGALWGALLVATASAHAQTGAPALVTEPQALTRYLKLKHVRPSQMAFWLDPAHNPRPLPFELAAYFQNRFTPKGAEDKIAVGAFELPGEIKQLIAVDPQNVLLVAGGSAEDVQRLQELVDILDQPIGQIEIELLVFEADGADLKSFDLQFPKTEAAPPAKSDAPTKTQAPLVGQLSRVRGDFRARLSASMANGRATLITSPRVNAANGFWTQLSSSYQRPIILAVSQNIPKPELVSLPISTYLLPSINGDGTISLQLEIFQAAPNPGANANLNSQAKSAGEPGFGANTNAYVNPYIRIPGEHAFEAIASVRDGGTLAITGLTALFPAPTPKMPAILDSNGVPLFLKRPETAPDRQVVIFLTARLVRPADEKTVPK